MEWINDLLTRPVFFLPILLILCYAVYSGLLVHRPIVPRDVPFARDDDRVKKAKSMPEKLRILKENYTDKGLKYIFTSAVGEPLVVLPPDCIPWIISHPESVLSAHETHRMQLQSDWTFLDQKIVQQPRHEEVVRANMVRKLDAFTEPVMDELRQCFEDYWGTSTEWHEVNIWDSMLKVFARTSNRMFVGLPLCRNEDFLDGCRGFAMDIVIAAFFLKFIPRWLKPIFGYLAIVPNWWHYRKAARYLLPMIQSHQAEIKENPDRDSAEYLPNDFVAWSVQHALQATDPQERTADLIAKRTMTINFAAIHTTTMTSHNFLIDLLGSDPKLGYLEGLTDEIAAINDSTNGDWSKSSLAAMTRVDSALRESMRLSGFVVFGIERKVVAKDGVILPDGTKIPYWGNLAVPAWGIHHDKQLYERPFEYDAFRFSKQRQTLNDAKVHVGEEGLVEGEEGYRMLEQKGVMKSEKVLSKLLEGKNLSTVTTGSNFMQFGHGKLSCPGRFFAVQEIKLMMAYMLLHYDIQYMPSKPAPKWRGHLAMSDTSASIIVRRKPGTVKA